jgi:2'-5' RNA ligase
LRDVFRPLLTSVEGRAVDRFNWHVTLAFIGDLDETSIPELQLKAAAIEVQPFRLRFERLTYWPRPKIACLQAMRVPPELQQLKSDLDAMLQIFGVEPELNEYRPHITAVRAARPFEPVQLARPVDTQWTGFELVESVSRPGGVQYRPLKQ